MKANLASQFHKVLEDFVTNVRCDARSGIVPVYQYGTRDNAAKPILPNLRQPGAPVQFAFANGHRVRSILEESGWAEIDIRPLDVA